MVDIPGVPALLDALDVLPFGDDLLTTDSINIPSFGYGRQWGLFLDGDLVVTADSVVSIDYKREWVIANYPVERGAFESYDKVQVPYELRVRFSSGGDYANREALLYAIKEIAGTLDLYDFVSPEVVYVSCNVTHFDYKRTASNGVGLIQVDVWLTQVIVNDSGWVDDSFSAASADQTNGGSVQTAPQTQADSSASDDAISQIYSDDFIGVF